MSRSVLTTVGLDFWNGVIAAERREVQVWQKAQTRVSRFSVTLKTIVTPYIRRCQSIEVQRFRIGTVGDGQYCHRSSLVKVTRQAGSSLL